MVRDREGSTGGRALLVGLGCFVFAGSAVALEVAGSLWANSDVPDWAGLAPLAWPRAARVALWSTVAAAAFLYRRSLSRAGLPSHPAMTILTVAPFLVYAVGIAAGAEWATWH